MSCSRPTASRTPSSGRLLPPGCATRARRTRRACLASGPPQARRDRAPPEADRHRIAKHAVPHLLDRATPSRRARSADRHGGRPRRRFDEQAALSPPAPRIPVGVHRSGGGLLVGNGHAHDRASAIPRSWLLALRGRRARPRIAAFCTIGDGALTGLTSGPVSRRKAGLSGSCRFRGPSVAPPLVRSVNGTRTRAGSGT